MNAIAKSATTMTSVELVDVINSMRKEGAPELAHRSFTAKIESHPGIDAAKFSASQKYGNNNTRKIYNLPEREAKLMVMSESLEVQTKVYDRMAELESKAPAGKSSALSPAKEFRALYGIAKLIGMDKNAAAISANQGVARLTGTNMLDLLGQTHIAAGNDIVFFTPTELGKRIGVSGQKMNTMLADAGLRVKCGESWDITAIGKPFARLYDTGKKHNSGVPVQQVKWAADVIAEVHRPHDPHGSGQAALI